MWGRKLFFGQRYINIHAQGDKKLKNEINAYVNPVEVSIIDTGIFDNSFMGEVYSSSEDGIEMSSSDIRFSYRDDEDFNYINIYLRKTPIKKYIILTRKSDLLKIFRSLADFGGLLLCLLTMTSIVFS